MWVLEIWSLIQYRHFLAAKLGLQNLEVAASDGSIKPIDLAGPLDFMFKCIVRVKIIATVAAYYPGESIIFAVRPRRYDSHCS